MQLLNPIYDYYRDHFRELPQEKQFHFATRIGAWRGDAWAQDILREQRPIYLPAETSIENTLSALINAPRELKSNAHELRQPYFDKYPMITGLNRAFFRLRHLESVYGIDARPSLATITHYADLIKLKSQLLNDPNAVSVLSTIAINYIYILETIINKTNDIPVQYFYDIGDLYDTSRPEHLQLLIYLYTHCIIGDSNFYTQAIPTDRLPMYIAMLERLDKIILMHFDDINLDNKLEFLVCARICHFESRNEARIYDECQQSVSPDGTYLIDVHNNNKQSNKISFADSEHRNVLFIMSATPYTPHSTLV